MEQQTTSCRTRTTRKTSRRYPWFTALTMALVQVEAVHLWQVSRSLLALQRCRRTVYRRSSPPRPGWWPGSGLGAVFLPLPASPFPLRALTGSRRGRIRKMHSVTSDCGTSVSTTTCSFEMIANRFTTDAGGFSTHKRSTTSSDSGLFRVSFVKLD